MPIKPQNYIPPAIPADHIRVWDYIDTRDYIDIPVSTLNSQNFPIEYIKTQLIQTFHPTTPTSSYGYEWDPNVDMNNKANLRIYMDALELVDLQGGIYAYHSWDDTYNPFPATNQLQLDVVYYSDQIKNLTVSGFRDIATGPVAGNYSEANGTYNIFPQSVYLFNQTWNNTTNQYERINRSVKKLQWSKNGTDYYWVEFVRNGNTSSGYYTLAYKTISLVGTITSRVLAKSEPVHLYGYNEDILKPTLINWVPSIDFAIGTGGYIQVNSISNHVVPQPKLKRTRIGSGFKVNGGGIKFMT